MFSDQHFNVRNVRIDFSLSRRKEILLCSILKSSFRLMRAARVR